MQTIHASGLTAAYTLLFLSAVLMASPDIVPEEGEVIIAESVPVAMKEGASDISADQPQKINLQDVEDLVEETTSKASHSTFLGDKTPGHTAAAPDCAMAYHMGAVLDVAEKICEAYKEASACAVARHGEPGCSRWVETKTLLSALSPKGPEAVWKVCCYRAYMIGGYETCPNPDPTCKSALSKHVVPGLASLAKSLVPLQKSHTEMTIDDVKRVRSEKQALSKDVVVKLNDMLDRLQAARSEMWKQPNCKKFAKPTPHAKCGFGGKKYGGQYHSLSRTDLYCETIEWQYTQMGAGDNYMKKCAGASFRTPAQDAAWKRAQAATIKSDLGIDVSTMPKAQIEAQFKAKMEAALEAQLKHNDDLNDAYVAEMA
jgi:hypothetical protein